MADISAERSHNYGTHKKQSNKISDRHYRDNRYDSFPSSREASRSRSKSKKKQPVKNEPQTEELDEAERMSLIAKLEKRKAEIWSMIQKLPICRRTSAIEQREKELFNNLDELQSQLNILSNFKILVV